MNSSHKKTSSHGKPAERKDSTVSEDQMAKKPVCDDPAYRAAKKLEGKRALITGGDSGIGRAVAIAFAKEGADVAIVYNEQDEDAQTTRKFVEGYGRKCLPIKCDISDEKSARQAVNTTARELGGLDILVNNAAVQFPSESFEELKMENMERTFRTNIFSMFYLTQTAVKYFKPGSSVINTTSITAFRGSDHLVDYSATKGAIAAFTRSLAKLLIEKGIRVNAVAPGPIWTPLIQASFSEEEQREFGKKTPMHRPGQPSEVAPSYVFLASNDASYITGQTIHPNGGEVVNA